MMLLMMSVKCEISAAGFDALKYEPRRLTALYHVSSMAGGELLTGRGQPTAPVEFVAPFRSAQRSFADGLMQSTSLEKFRLPATPSVTMNCTTWRQLAGSFAGLKYISSACC